MYTIFNKNNSRLENKIWIEECRGSTGVTDSDLLGALSDLLEGMAAKWGRLEKHR